MRKAHEKVIKAFSRGELAHDVLQKEVGAYRIWTDGIQLFSYLMPIAKRIAHGKRVSFQLVDYSQAPTATTRAHIRACERLLTGRIANYRLASLKG
jgi:hypothetical protein